jgi:hypothetical protein
MGGKKQPPSPPPPPHTNNREIALAARRTKNKETSKTGLFNSRKNQKQPIFNLNIYGKNTYLPTPQNTGKNPARKPLRAVFKYTESIIIRRVL